jgi:small GTP-binding protein
MEERQYTVVFIGEIAVGKKGLIRSQMGSDFDPCHQQTVGIQTTFTTVQVLNRIVSLKLMDTAGQEKFIKSIKFFVQSAAVVAICFDPTPSDGRTPTWVDGAQPYVDVARDVNPNCPMIAIATKQDLRPDGVPTLPEITRIVKTRLGIDTVMEVSAKTGYGVDDAFEEIARIANGSGCREPSRTVDLAQVNTVRTGAGGCAC